MYSIDRVDVRWVCADRVCNKNSTGATSLHSVDSDEVNQLWKFPSICGYPKLAGWFISWNIPSMDVAGGTSMTLETSIHTDRI